MLTCFTADTIVKWNWQISIADNGFTVVLKRLLTVLHSITSHHQDVLTKSAYISLHVLLYFSSINVNNYLTQTVKQCAYLVNGF